MKDYGIAGQIGYGQSLHEYLLDLYRVWAESHRVLRGGGRLCVNVGDQFARSIIYGRYKVIPIHAEIIAQCEKTGFDYMGSIIWQKKTTMNTTGGANVMGSFPYPPNGMVEIDYEFILIFKKPGRSKKVFPEVKKLSELSKEEWKEYFSGHWNFRGARQLGHEAMFPEELPRRLIRMFTFVGDTVLDPFLGSGTTVKVALDLDRNVIGYEINKDFIEIIKDKIGLNDSLFRINDDIQIIESAKKITDWPAVDYIPMVQDARPQLDPEEFSRGRERLYRVVEIIDENTIKLDTGLMVKFLGIEIKRKDETIKYLRDYILGKEVFLRPRKFEISDNGDKAETYVYLKNKIFINAYLIKAGLGIPDLSVNHKFRKKFIRLWKEKGGVIG
ncbi:MAG: DNA methyltransferase [Anaerolineae bacterium]